MPPERWNFFTRYSSESYDDDKFWRWSTRCRSLFWGYGGVKSGLNTYGLWDYPILGIPELFVSPSSGGHYVNICSPNEINTMVGQSLDAMLPGIRPELSLVNSIIELKDFKSLPRTLRNIKNLTKSITTLDWGSLSLRRLIRGGSDVYLQTQFNILPLLSDITGIKNAIIRTRQKVQNLLENEGRLLTKHYARPINTLTPSHDYVTSDPGSLPSYMSPGSVTFERDTSYESSMFRAMIEYSYELDPWARQQAQLRGLLDALGVNCNPQIIWNAIPWSFVVDWVVGVNRWLDQFKTRNLEPVTHIKRYMISLSTVRTIRTYHTFNTYSGTSGQVPSVIITEKAYIRSNRNADMIRWFQTSGLNLKEFSLAAALGGSRI
jgi:hypothetical protein